MISHEQENKVKDEIIKIIIDNIRLNPITNDLWNNFRKYNEQAYKNIDNLNIFLNEVFAVFSKNEHVYINLLDEKLESELKSILDNLRKIDQTNARPGRYLSYAISDENGNTHSGVITKKDESIIDILTNYGFSRRLEDQIIDECNNTYELISNNYSGDCWLDKFEEYLKSLIKDKSVSLEDFSKIIESFIPDTRHSGCSTSWVTFEETK